MTPLLAENVLKIGHGEALWDPSNDSPTGEKSGSDVRDPSKGKLFNKSRPLYGAEFNSWYDRLTRGQKTAFVNKAIKREGGQSHHVCMARRRQLVKHSGHVVFLLIFLVRLLL